MSKRIFAILSFLLLNSLIFGQNKELYKSAEITKSKSYGRDYIKGMVVVKIKNEKKNEVASIKDKNPVLQKLYKEIGSTGMHPIFPESQAPSVEKNRMGVPMVDLTSFYVIKYSSTSPIEDIIKKLESSGLVEFAEPMFVNYPLYVPSDPLAHPITGPQNFYLTNMQAYEAWDITRGDTNVVIGIIDTGVKWDHPDLVDNIKYNWNDPINGVDDDNDGYVDNFRGWDLFNNDNNPTPPVNDHGTRVAGMAAATTDNGIGVAGTGFKCKILPLKASSDAGGAIFPGYDAIIYAANKGAKVINLSWGGPNQPSALEQAVINYAVINKDAVVIAAAGNTPSDLKFYPASYDNVLSVASCDTMYFPSRDTSIEVRAAHATFNYSVDVCAQGRRVMSTINSGYTTGTGSSFAAPLVSGIAGLVRSHYPSLTALQVMEKIRVTCDPLDDTLAENITYVQEKLGKGRVNMYRALTDNVLPAVRMYRRVHYDKFGEYAFSDDTVRINAYFRNYLEPTTSGAKVTLSSFSPNVTVVKNNFNLGSIPTLDSINNSLDPFVIYVHPTAGVNEMVTLRLGYEDLAKGYTDYQYFEILVNPAFIDIDTNLVTLTVTSRGKLGYTDDNSSIGNGFSYKGQDLLFEGGLMIGRSNSKVSDCVRSTPPGVVDADFSATKFVKYVNAFEGDQEASSTFTDAASWDPIGLEVRQRTYARKNSPDNKYIIIEYDIKNQSGTHLDSLNVGLFCDWDVANYNQNKANWLDEDSIGYVYFTGANGLHAGVCLLTPHKPSCFSMDHGSVGGNNINPNDGFTPAEKFTTLANGIARPKAGGTGLGFDVSQVVGGVINNIAPGQTKTIAFALVAGDDVLDLKSSARRAKNLFRSLNTSPTPVIPDMNYCKGDTVDVTIAPTNGSTFNFYTSPTSGSPVLTGSNYTINDVYASQTIYVRGTDSLFESGNVAANIIVHNDLVANFSFAPDTVNLNVSPHAFFVNTSLNSNAVNWSITDGTTSSSNSFLHTFTTQGKYFVTLKATGSFSCMDSIVKEIVVIGTTNINDPDFYKQLYLYPNPSSGEINIEFMLHSEEDISIRIINSLGQEVYTKDLKGIQFDKQVLNFTENGKGIYFAHFKVGNKMTVRKIVIQ